MNFSEFVNFSKSSNFFQVHELFKKPRTLFLNLRTFFEICEQL